MPRGASPKREQEFKELESEFKKEHRYPGREEEVAARIVNKQRAQYGETRVEKQKDKEGKSPDRGLPLKDYQSMTIAEVSSRLNELTPAQIRKIRDYELAHKNRKGLLEAIGRRLDR
jgi:hypothetical protein